MWVSPTVTLALKDMYRRGEISAVNGDPTLWYQLPLLSICFGRPYFPLSWRCSSKEEGFLSLGSQNHKYSLTKLANGLTLSFLAIINIGFLMLQVSFWLICMEMNKPFIFFYLKSPTIEILITILSLLLQRILQVKILINVVSLYLYMDSIRPHGRLRLDYLCIRSSPEVQTTEYYPFCAYRIIHLGPFPPAGLIGKSALEGSMEGILRLCLSN